MSITNDFRSAAGLRSWPAAEDLAAADSSGSGLFETTDQDGWRHLTNVRKIVGRPRTRHAPGSVLIGAGGWLLALLGAGLFLVSFSGQFKYIFAERHEGIPSVILAGSFDLAMVIFTVLALGLARAGKPARTERALILACSIGSAAMNYAAANTASPRSVLAYVAAPVLLAVVVDRVVAVIRRHVLADDEKSPWAPLAWFLAALVRAVGLVALYLLRLVLARRETWQGLKQMVLDAAPLPAAPERPAIEPSDVEPPELAGASKKTRLAWWYERDPDYRNRSVVAAVAKRLAPKVDLAEGTARAYLGQICADLEKAGETS
jgi:Protein of unknown function (DUF2637)